MQDLDWPFNPQPGLCHFIQSSPGIREKHSTNLRLIVLIHSTFFRERHILNIVLLSCYVAKLHCYIVTKLHCYIVTKLHCDYD